MRKRDHAIKKFINKKKIIVPSEMLRAEHFFYKNGKLIWVFFSSNIDLNSQQNIDQFINQTIQEHKNYEKQLGRNEINRIVFKDINISQKNSKKTPKVTNLKKEPTNQLKDLEKKRIIEINDSDDLTKQLNDLNQLYKSGVLTKEEFKKAKKKILN